jgi:hypothetical protein
MMEKLFQPWPYTKAMYGLTIHHEWSISVSKLTHKPVGTMKTKTIQSATVTAPLLRHNSVSKSPFEVCKNMHDRCLQGSACLLYS